MRTSLLFVTCSSLLATVACGTSDDGGDTTPKTREDYEDVAQSLGSSLASGGGGDTASFGDAVSLGRGVTPPELSVGAGGHIGGLRFGLDLSYVVTCKDAAGDVMPVCDDTTDAADLELDASGSIDLPRLSAAVARSASWHLTDLTTPVALLDGEGTLAFDSTVIPADREERTYELDLDTTYDRVAIRESDHRAIGGAISYDIAAQRTIGDDVVASFDMEAVVTFQENGDAVVVLDGETSFRIDTITGNVSAF